MTHTPTSSRALSSRAMRSALLACVAAGSAIAAHAQRDDSAPIDARWRAYLGCWSTSAAGLPGPTVCLLPTRDAATVELVSLVGDSISPAARLTANGQKIAREKDGCSGWETVRWSSDDRRLYTESEFSCSDGVPQRTTGLLAHQGTGFLQIEGVKTRSTTGIRVMRFEAFADSAGLPDAIRRRLPGWSLTQAWASRVEASASVSTLDVAETAKEVGAPVTEAWLAERGQRFALTGKDLRALRDAGTPTSVIDMMVAVSHPEIFTVAQGTPGARERAPNPRNASGMRGTRLPIGIDPYYGFGDPYFPYWGFDPYGFGGGAFFSPFGFGFNRFGFNQFGFNQFGYGGLYGGGLYGNGWFGGGPYVIVPTTPGTQAPPGRAVNGRGYTRGGNSGDGRGASPQPSVQSGGGYSNGGSSSAGSGSSNGGGGSSSSGGGARTAKPRP
ncbi:MAG: hypothetical protein U5K74_16210 [Gemmatimonadaceae bacterium]|nr:hypothetical protein [Gemmatimonadaceae bacterium]